MIANVATIKTVIDTTVTNSGRLSSGFIATPLAFFKKHKY